MIGTLRPVRIVACRPVARRRPRDWRLYSGRSKAAARTQQERKVFSARSVPMAAHATQARRQRNAVLCAVRAEVL
jgi:hypothetical protein